jgi:hypothetical protein
VIKEALTIGAPREHGVAGQGRRDHDHRPSMPPGDLTAAWDHRMVTEPRTAMTHLTHGLARRMTVPVATAASPLRVGQPLVHRLFAKGQLGLVRTGRVVAHDERGLRLWWRAGYPTLGLRTVDGRGVRDMPFHEWVRQERLLVPGAWVGPDILMLVPPGAAHSVWWFYDHSPTRGSARPGDGAFQAWYVNLEEPAVVWHDGDVAGVDTVDQDLDAIAHPDGTWTWKDEDEFAERLAHPEHYWVSDEQAVRAEGDRVMKRFAAGEFPFDGTWCDFAPDPSWPAPESVPAGALRPQVHYGK